MKRQSRRQRCKDRTTELSVSKRNHWHTTESRRRAQSVPNYYRRLCWIADLPDSLFDSKSSRDKLKAALQKYLQLFSDPHKESKKLMQRWFLYHSPSEVQAKCEYELTKGREPSEADIVYVLRRGLEDFYHCEQEVTIKLSDKKSFQLDLVCYDKQTHDPVLILEVKKRRLKAVRPGKGGKQWSQEPEVKKQLRKYSKTGLNIDCVCGMSAAKKYLSSGTFRQLSEKHTVRIFG
jgi:hypothetical protein